MQLMNKLLQLIAADEIYVLTMDREFHGKEWLKWLDKRGVGFVLRIKNNTIVGSKLAKEHAISRGTKPRGLQEVFGMQLYFACKKMKANGRDTHLLVVSNRIQGKKVLDVYKRRWGIERLFGHLKKKGFDLEATHMTSAPKLEKLFAVLCIAFTYSYAWGCYLRHHGIKRNAASNRKSLFRLGLEDILTLLEFSSSKAHRSKPVHPFIRWLRKDPFDEIFLV